MIYFIRQGKYVKIGRTNNLDRRFRELKTGAPKELRLVAAMEGESETESALHYMFRDLRVEGEWFRYAKLTEAVCHLLSQGLSIRNLRDLEREGYALMIRRNANRKAQRGNRKLKNRIAAVQKAAVKRKEKAPYGL